MQRFNAERFVAALILLSGIRQAMITGEPASVYDTEAMADILRTQVSDFEKMVGQMGLPVTKKAVRNLSTTMGGGIIPVGGPIRRDQSALIERRIKDICDRLRDELDGRVFFQINRSEYFEQLDPLFGSDVQAKFPSASAEIEEAGKCLALQRPTACVMHLMRVLELGLHSLADVFSVPFANANWHTIIDQIEKHVKGITSISHGPNWKDEQQFYSEAAAHFRLLKDAWRNHSMHIHERYSEERAETIFQSVRSFMQHLATRLSEPS